MEEIYNSAEHMVIMTAAGYEITIETALLAALLLTSAVLAVHMVISIIRILRVKHSRKSVMLKEKGASRKCL